MDDSQLLQEYVTSQSEAAFERLVDRHIGLVYATALRRLNGDAHLAQDVAQLVFTNLARKAHHLPTGVVLAGWLHRDTCFTTLEIIRRERRRHAREQATLAMPENEPDPAPVDWEQLRPCLDEALNQLPAKDRDALLLRFFEQRSLLEIGERLGFGESGASRRVTRALEKLRALLARRGVTASSAALSAALATQLASSAQAASPGLAASVAAASVATAASATANTTIASIAMASIKTKIGIAALVSAAVLVPLGLHHHHRYRQSAANEFRDRERESIREAAQHMLSLMVYASENNNQLPATLDDVGLADDRFELVYKGPLPSDTNQAPYTIVIREKRPWRSSKGGWARAYGYADGHSQLGTSPDGDFTEWEAQAGTSRPIAAALPNAAGARQ